MSKNEKSVVLCEGGLISGNHDVAIGDDLDILLDDAVAVGRSCRSLGEASVAIGSTTSASENYAVAIGTRVMATEQCAAVIGGFDAQAAGEGTALLGSMRGVSEIPFSISTSNNAPSPKVCKRLTSAGALLHRAGFGSVALYEVDDAAVDVIRLTVTAEVEEEEIYTSNFMCRVKKGEIQVQSDGPLFGEDSEFPFSINLRFNKRNKAKEITVIAVDGERKGYLSVTAVVNRLKLEQKE